MGLCVVTGGSGDGHSIYSDSTSLVLVPLVRKKAITMLYKVSRIDECTIKANSVTYSTANSAVLIQSISALLSSLPILRIYPYIQHIL